MLAVGNRPYVHCQFVVPTQWMPQFSNGPIKSQSKANSALEKRRMNDNYANAAQSIPQHLILTSIL